jgi:hypothetical protein
MIHKSRNRIGAIEHIDTSWLTLRSECNVNVFQPDLGTMFEIMWERKVPRNSVIRTQGL